MVVSKRVDLGVDVPVTFVDVRVDGDDRAHVNLNAN
jgi:hypothetical protein